MTQKVGRYSKYIKPITYVVDLLTINTLPFLFFFSFNSYYFNFFITLSWIIISINLKFYDVFRFTKIISIANKLVKQFVLFALICYAFFGFYFNGFQSSIIVNYAVTSFLIVGVFKISVFYLLKKYRSQFGGNIRNIVIVGNGEKAQQLSELFKNKPDFGYHVVQFFKFKNDKNKAIDDVFDFVLTSKIDAIYCSLHQLTLDEIYRFTDFSDDNLKEVKFLPENNEVFSMNHHVDFYEYIPVISIQKTSLHDPITKIVKRTFDVIFSLLVIVLVLLWLIPILAILIKLESKGPVFFKQGRPGIDEKEFFCYKFRSMNINETTEKEASKNDPRVTRIGRFIRKTSIDELPQFFNVLLGEMSVVGPRPHLWSQNISYSKKIRKYMMRHYVKPGITGLAQVNGYRGEIETDKDMINRINYDVFYIENWSVILDIKIIGQTVINIFKGEEKAY